MAQLTRLSRRTLLVGLGSSTAGLIALTACARLARLGRAGAPLIGVLANVSAAGMAVPFEGLRAGLREHGLVEGDNVRIEWRFADGNNDLLPGLVAELLSLGARLLVTNGGATPVAARQATSRVPIVVMGGVSLVPQGLAASFSRPGGNVTGIQEPLELSGKALEPLLEVVPQAQRLALLANLSIGSAAPGIVIAAAEQLRLELLTLDIRLQSDLEPAFERAAAWGADMLYAHNVVPLNTPRALLPDLARRWRLPAVSVAVEWTAAGLLLSYSPNNWHAGYRAADYVARILHGADPAELPVELMTIFDLSIHRRTLDHLRLSLPPHIAAQVTRWID